MALVYASVLQAAETASDWTFVSWVVETVSRAHFRAWSSLWEIPITNIKQSVEQGLQ